MLWCIPVVFAWWWLKSCVMHLHSQMPISVLHTEFQAYYVYECFGTYFVSSYNLWKADQLESKNIAVWSVTLRIAARTSGAHGSSSVQHLQ